jgi:membrane associated rhomboid family serine protease
MRRGTWPLVGLVVGAAGGGLWGWFGNDYEPIDSAVGTGFLGALAGLLVGTVAYALAGRRRSRRDRQS